MNSTKHSHVICPKCGHQFSQPQQNVDKTSHGMRCIECDEPIIGAPLSFGGYFACEPCVIAYYHQDGPKIVKQELRERRVVAARILHQRGRDEA